MFSSQSFHSLSIVPYGVTFSTAKVGQFVKADSSQANAATSLLQTLKTDLRDSQNPDLEGSFSTALCPTQSARFQDETARLEYGDSRDGERP